MNVDWDLSQSLESDGQGIRAACVLPKDENVGGPDSFSILTGTQGGTLVEYGVPSGSLNPVEYQHNHAVTALASFSTNGKLYYATGCKDSVVRVFDATTHALVSEFSGHEKAVTSLAFMEPHFLVTGSWDGAAKVWNLQNHALVCTLEGHENTVSVCVLRDGIICTGSAGVAQNNTISNHAIRIWQVNTTTGEVKLLHKVANDHDGPIRDVQCFNSVLASCSNDGTVKLRDTDSGECTSTLVLVTEGSQQHAPMLLSTIVSDGFIAASAEDGHVVVFSGNQQQLLRHASCVWKVLSLPNGDLATCSDDGVLRIFTTATDRMASEQQRKQFVESVQAALQKRSGGPSPEEVAKLPKWEMNALQTGRSEGQVQVFNKNGVAIAAQWSDVSKTWIEVGQVMGSKEEEQGTIDGVAYSHVLPIEVDRPDGSVAKLQIGYNDGENPFVAAQRFIDHHVLPQHHLADIADYIRQRVGHAQPTLGAASAPTTSNALLLQHLPFRGYKSFELSTKSAATTMEKMSTKILQFNVSAEHKIDRSVLKSLTDKLVATSHYHSCQISETELSLIITMLQHWPPAQAFGGLDLARLTVLVPDGASATRTSYWKEVLQLALQQCQQNDGSDKTAAVAVPMLSLRLFCNCFRGGPGSLAAVTETDQLDAILTCTESSVPSNNKNVRLSVATVLLNVASYLNSSSGDNAAAVFGPRVVQMVSSALESKAYNNDSEAITRLLVALGTVVLNNDSAKDAAKQLYLQSKVEPAASPHGDKAKAVAKEIYTILQ